MIKIGLYDRIEVITAGSYWSQSEADDIAEWYVRKILRSEAGYVHTPKKQSRKYLVMETGKKKGKN